MTAPILLIIFNRPRTTAPVMEAIRAAQPERLYVAADGPRIHKFGNGDVELDKNDVRLCQEARAIALNVDWDCDIKLQFLEANLGCRFGPVNAINWFFQNEEAGIILEDDCLPSKSFFPFCNELLEHFRDDERVMAITGDNFQVDMGWCEHSYYFSRWFHTWGWASWARAWKLYDQDLTLYAEWIKHDHYKSVSSLPGFAEYWVPHFDQMKSSKDVWDYLWLLSCWANSGLTITPRANLVSNIGFGPDGTHCPSPKHRLSNLPRFELEFPMTHPKLVVPSIDADDHISRYVFRINA